MLLRFRPFVRKKQHLPTNGGRCRTLTRPSSYIILILQKKKKRKLRRLPFFYFLVSFIFLDFAYSVSVREGGKMLTVLAIYWYDQWYLKLLKFFFLIK